MIQANATTTTPAVGVYQHVPFDVYTAWQAERISNLSALQHSERAYVAACAGERASTDAMDEGAALHALVLEPDTFCDRFAIWDGGNRSGSEWDKFEAQHADLIILTTTQRAKVASWLAGIQREPGAVSEIEAMCSREISCIWRDPVTGTLCKGRIDGVSDEHITCIKTTAKATPREFDNDATNLLYPPKLAWYKDGYNLALQQSGAGSCDLPAQIIAVFKGNKHFPVDCWVAEITEEVLEHGRALYNSWLSDAQRVDLRNPKGVSQGRRLHFTLPAWAEGQLPMTVLHDGRGEVIAF